MSTSTEGVPVPEWDLADRLGKSLKVADMSPHQMAEYLEVHRNTVSAWINGRTRPSGQSVRLWALRTGVSHEWLKTGAVTISDGPDDGPGLRITSLKDHLRQTEMRRPRAGDKSPRRTA